MKVGDIPTCTSHNDKELRCTSTDPIRNKV